MSSLLCRKSTKTYGKTNTFGGIWYARQIFSVIIIFLKTLLFGKIENAIIFQHIPARDIVCTRICRYGKRRQKICLKRTLRLNLSNPISFYLLFYTFILLIFNDLQANVRIRDFFMLIMHLSQEEESGLLSLRKDIETPNKHTKRME